MHNLNYARTVLTGQPLPHKERASKLGGASRFGRA